MNVNMEQAAAMLVDAGQTLTKIATERDGLNVKLASVTAERDALRKRMEAEKIAAEMHDKGVHLDVAFDKLASALEQEADSRLEVIKVALQMRPEDMGHGLTLSDADAARAGSDLETYILGTVG